VTRKDERVTDEMAPYHGHIYYSAEERPAAVALRDQFMACAKPGSIPDILFVGRMVDSGVGPHPIAQFEVHFLKRSLEDVVSMIEMSGMRALIHPLTNDDLADHTTLGRWIGEPLELDLTTLDPLGYNQGVPRFGRADF